MTLAAADELAVAAAWDKFEALLDARPELARAIVGRLLKDGDPNCEAKLQALRRAATRITGAAAQEEPWWSMPHPGLCGRTPKQVFGDNPQARHLLRSVWQP